MNAHWGPEFEERVLKNLGLAREPVSTQVIPRDRHAEFLMVLAICGSSMERIAIELRHLQRSEVAEVLESFKKGQKGSSAMPHKRNPISSENLTGAARLLRSYAQAGSENVALWHERDISHSSVERMAFPDATILLDYALHRLNGILGQMVVRKQNVGANLEKAGSTVFSGIIFWSSSEAERPAKTPMPGCNPARSRASKEKGSFVELLTKHPEISKILGAKKIRELGSIKHQLRKMFPRSTKGRSKRERFSPR